MHVETRDGKLYVAEYLNDRIQVFSLAGESLSSVGTSGSGPGEFDAPGGVGVDAAGRLYVADFYNHRIQVFDSEGRPRPQLGTTGKKGISAGEFNYPTDTAVLSDGNIAVADAYNDRIQIFTPEGEFLRKWGGPFATDIPGSANGWFNVATGVGAGKDGVVFVADFYNHRIQKFTSEGEFLVAFGEEGTGEGQLDRPTDMAVDDDGNVYVVDFGNHRVQVFEPVGG